MFTSIIGSLYNESPVTNSSSLTTEGPSDNAPLSSEEISEAQRLLLTRVMQRADARSKSSVSPQAETVPLQAEDCTSADCAVVTTSRVEEEEEEQKRGREGAGARAQKKVRRRTTENVVKVCKKMKSSVPVGRPQTRRFQE
jgi:hypothetical protein